MFPRCKDHVCHIETRNVLGFLSLWRNDTVMTFRNVRCFHRIYTVHLIIHYSNASNALFVLHCRVALVVAATLPPCRVPLDPLPPVAAAPLCRLACYSMLLQLLRISL